jgi:uncharacterized protein (TIGR00251 family)
MHGRKTPDHQGRAGSPLPAAVGKTHDGAHGVTRPALPVFITVQPDGVTLAIKLQPRASTNEIGAATGAELRIRVTAPPVDAAANEALLRLLADTLGCPRGKVELIRGHTSRHKTVKVYGVTATEVFTKLDSAGT